MKKVLLVLLPALLFLGAKGCSNCEKATAERIAACTQYGGTSLECEQAKVEEARICNPTPEPTPTPTPIPLPTPTPTPTPPPVVPPSVTCQAVELVANEAQGPAQLQAKVKAAIAEMGDPTGIDPGVTLQALAGKLCTGGLYAFAGEEAIFVRRVDGLYEEYHPVYFGTGAWTDSGNGKFIGLHRLASEVPPEPPPEVTDLCPATPCPPRTYEDGRPHWQYNAHQHTMGNGDSTPITVGTCDYCASIGMGEAGGAIRCSCPVRPDGHPDRVIVEAWLTEGGPTRDSRNGQDCTPNGTDNPAAFLWGTGNCRMCNKPLTVCTGWF